MQIKSNKKTKEGIVYSNKMDKTIVVLVERKVRHPIYKKNIKRTKKFKAHDELNVCNVGDKVKIEETRPLSKEKRWRLLEILKQSIQEA